MRTTVDGFARFHDEIARRFGLGEVEARGGGPFQATFDVRLVAGLSLVAVESDAVRIERTRRDISHTGRDAFTLGVVMAGHAVVSQGAREAHVGPHDLVLCDARRPFQMTFDGRFAQLLVDLDAAELTTRLPAVERLTAMPVAGGSGVASVTRAFLRTLRDEAGAVAGVATSLADHALDLAALTFASAFAPRAHDDLLRTRVRAFIEQHLDDPALSPDGIAGAHRISRRLLYRLFEGTPESVSAYLWRRRLERCRAALADPGGRHRSITEVAFACGFSSASHFSRAFHKTFGMSPRVFRVAATGSWLPPPEALSSRNRQG